MGATTPELTSHSSLMAAANSRIFSRPTSK
ncbi:Uncharacterised protein [Mycobacteroides abscessus subsp. abscessus]|nr:Uncharacterised protein [Mycobacteroides abscessus subsp. abscessus]SIN44488.1 Uncharacterised protein [Mycobacteroides abscessus subsp. abscessus]